MYLVETGRAAFDALAVGAVEYREVAADVAIHRVLAVAAA